MSEFLRILKKHQAEIERMVEEHEQGGTPISYSMMRDMGMLKPFAVRLPVPLVAALDEMVKHGLWSSKQEMVYDMIQSAFSDFLDTSSDKTKEQFIEVQKTAWEKWEKRHKNKERTFNFSERTYEKERPRRIKVNKSKK